LSPNPRPRDLGTEMQRLRAATAPEEQASPGWFARAELSLIRQFPDAFPDDCDYDGILANAEAALRFALAQPPPSGRPALSVVPDQSSEREPPPTSSGPGLGYEFDNRWVEVADRLEEMVNAIQEHMRPVGDYFGSETLRDVLVEPPGPHCERAPKFARLDRRNAKFATWVGRCNKGGCSRCLPAYIHAELEAFFHYFDFAPTLWRTEFADKAAWRRFTKHGAAKGAKAFFQADGTVIAFSATAGNEQVPALSSLLAALLGAAADPGRMKRHSQIPRRRKPDADPLQRTEPVARGERLEDVKLRASNALGGVPADAWKKQIHRPRSKTDISHELPGLAEEHYPALDTVLDGIRQRSSAEFAEMLTIARLNREARENGWAEALDGLS
jgi:hypothetical protein